MRYYRNKVTGELMGSYHNLRDIILPPTTESAKYGWIKYRIEVVTDVILPNKILGNGIESYCMPYWFIRDNYKRVNKVLALSLYPDFHQYRYDDLPKVSQPERLEVISKQTI